MKLVLKIWFFMSFIFCQQLPSKAEYFLSNKKNFDKLDEKISTQIKKELNKIEIKIKKELKISYKIENTQEQVSERRITGPISSKKESISAIRFGRVIKSKVG